MSPETTKAARPGAASDSMTQQATNNVKDNVAHAPAARHVPAQTPIARFLLVHEHRPGRRIADAWPLDGCPVCGYQSRHNVTWPPPETVTKKCTTCGYSDSFATIPIKVGSRRNRRAA